MNSARAVLLAPAKVNLHLEVLRAREDGYHEVETILQAVDLFDTVEVALEPQKTGRPTEISLAVMPGGAAPLGPDNLCWRAAALFCRERGVSGRLAITLHKEIPVAAGLGGGSSDAAAVLVACNRLFAAGLDAAELEALAAEIGSDVPFFIRGATRLGRGRGTELSDLPAIRKGSFLIVKPDIDIETSQIYSQLKMGLTVRGPKCNIRHAKALIARFPTGSWFGFNRLEEVVLPAYPVVQRLVLRLRELAPIAMLSGSGSAVVAVFAERSWRRQLMDEFADPAWFVRVVAAHPAGVVFRDEPPPELGSHP